MFEFLFIILYLVILIRLVVLHSYRYLLSEQHQENEVTGDLLFIGKKILSDY
jgi:hypothetical protein